MKLKALNLTNFRCFESLTITFEKHLTVLVAPNGGGKSTVLNAVALGLGPVLTRLPKVSGINPKHTDLRVEPNGDVTPRMRIELETYQGLSWDRNKLRDSTQVSENNKGLSDLNDYVDSLITEFNSEGCSKFPIIIYYGTGRGVMDVPQERGALQKDFSFADGYRNALESKANFKQFFEYFYFLEDLERRGKEAHRDWSYQQPELAAIRQAISTMMPDFENPRTDVLPVRFLVDWMYDSELQPLRIEQLSDGYRITLAMVMDIASRMARVNPKAKDVLDNEGIVLIDEVDLHLHPKWQQTILPDLMRTFPNVQFIVSTHSPQVLSTVPKECIRVLGQNQLDESIASIPLAHSYGEPSNDVLQAIMHVDPQPPVPEKEDLQRLTSLVDQGSYQASEATELLDSLKRRLNEHHPQIEKIERSIRRQEALKG